jgi:hypothetical protein
MIKAVILSIGVASANVCTDIKKVYKDSICCGGHGEAFCAASDTFDFDTVMQKLNSIESLLQSGGGNMGTKKVYLDDLCFPDKPPEQSVLGRWPPSAERSLYANSDGYPGFGNLDVTKSPHRTDYPPFFALCTSAQNMASLVSAKCPELGTVGSPGFYDTFIATTKTSFESLSPFCQSGSKLIIMFSMVMQLEYYTAFDMTDIGTTYLSSIFSGTIEGFPGDLQVSDLEVSYAQLTDEMAADLVDTEALTLTATIDTFRGHVAVTNNGARQTSGLVIPEQERVIMVPYGGQDYPEHYDICLASRRMYDYMVQNPTLFYPELGDTYGEGYNYMVRCGSKGGSILKVQSTILGMEKDASEDPATCPSHDQVFNLVNPISVTLKRLGEKYTGKSCLVSNCAAAGPAQSESFFFVRNDIEYMRSLWVTFLNVHLEALRTYCGTNYTARDPWGQTAIVYTIEQLLELRSIQETMYPVVQPSEYNSSYNCIGYGYNNALPPYESKCTLSLDAYPPPSPIDILKFLHPEEQVCEDDPVQRMQYDAGMRGGATLEKVDGRTTFLDWKRTFSKAVNIPFTDCQVCSFGLPGHIVPDHVTGQKTLAMMFPKTCQQCPGISTPFCS